MPYVPASIRKYKAQQGRKKTAEDEKQEQKKVLNHAAALQDHWSRMLQMGGGSSRALPSLKPGSKMTLAQMYGLIEKPKQLLTDAQWKDVHKQSRLRQDSCSICPICRDDFRAEEQVLLSCSHVFHATCLASFERYARQKCCPLCRAEWYQKRAISDGAVVYRDRCATRIQAAWRGRLARKEYKILWLATPPKDPALHRKWCADRLEEETEKMMAAIEKEEDDLDALFAELDANVEESRKIMAVAEPVAHAAAVDAIRTADNEASTSQAGDPEAAFPPRGVGSLRPAAGISLTSSGASGSGSRPGTGAVCEVVPGVASMPDENGVRWDEVLDRALSRGDNECSICIGVLHSKGLDNVAWLSCSHCFHWDCIAAFEAFELTRGGTPTCPYCRSTYTRKRMMV